MLKALFAKNILKTLSINNQLTNFPCLNRCYSKSIEYKHILTEIKGKNKDIALIQLNRPKSLNALCDELIADLSDAVRKYDKDPSIAVMILTGNERAFAAGADIKEMLNKNFSSIYLERYLDSWNVVANVRKPVIAAVNGHAAGGGCELAMMCDIMIAGDKAKFSQAEINIGATPGAGGSQRLIRVIGKSKAMEMVLSGNPIDAKEAQLFGLVSAIHPSEKLIDEAIKLAEQIASHSKIVVQLAKEAVNSAYETTLAQGISHKKKLFYSSFATNDRKEGMSAFVEKRKPTFTDE